ncbi:MAG TPA: DUF3060 domain-containing protein, partial [Rickettsiales bacterium]|nr:DUF3060 domain-containing protein [Rickettsiales bacterium]
GGNTITINGGGNTVSAANGDTINLSGNGTTGANGGIDTVNMYYGTINVSANTDVQGNYSGNTINVANNDTVSVSGNANTVTSTGSNTSISVTGNNNIVNAVASDTVTIAGNGDTVNTTGAATISLSGYSNIVNAYSGSSITLATNATATINGSNLTIQGNGNHYQFARGAGQDILTNGLSTNTGPSGELDMGTNIAKDQIWFEKVGNNLQVDILGTTDHMTINNWYSNSYSQLSSIHTAAGNVIDTQIAQLVQAMATYSANNSGFNPTTATAMPTDPTLQSTLAASWH